MADNLRGGGSDAATAGGEAVSKEDLDEDMMRGDVEIVKILLENSADLYNNHQFPIFFYLEKPP